MNSITPADEAISDPDRWISEARLGSTEALNSLMALLADRLLAELGNRRLRGLSPSRSGSDLVQETVLRAREMFYKFEGTTFEEFRRWARGILHLRRRHWVRRHRDRTNEKKIEQIWRSIVRKQNLVEEAKPDGAGQEGLERQEDATKLNTALALLKPHEQYMIKLRVIDDRSFKEIASIVNKSEGTVNRACNRAIKRLRRYFESHGKH